jgi:hypothetical protein
MSKPGGLPRARLLIAGMLSLVLSSAFLFGQAPGAQAAPVVSVGSVGGQFFPDPVGSGVFNATPASTAAFSQTFPVINFNPPSTSFCSNAVGVNIGTRPFTDVVPQSNGTCSTVVAAGNGFQAGVGSLSNFQAVFSTNLIVSGPSDVTFSFFSDDGWIAGIGPGPGSLQPTRVSGSLTNPPASGQSPFHAYPVLGSFNVASSPVGQQMVVHFPAAGSYPAEFDYVECCGGALSFTVQANGAPIPPSAPTLTTQASPNVTVGGTIIDTASLSGVIPTGQITFNLYGPGDSACTNSIHSQAVSVNGNGTYPAAPFTPPSAGTYRWVASYGGDANNASVTTSCSDPLEQVTVTKASPGISTTPSGSVPAGGAVSDSATLIGGFNPSGAVVFTLYAPGDTACQNPLASQTGTLTGGTASSGPVPVGAAGTYNWVASYGGDANNKAVTSPCGSEPVVVTPQTLTGRAFGLSANVTLLGGGLIAVNPVPDTGNIAATSSSTTTTPCVATITGIVGAHVLCANVTTVGYPGRSTASASVADVGTAIAGIPTITIRAAQSTSSTTCAGSAGSTTIDYLAVGSTVVIAVPTQVAPNTTINVGVVKLVLNEQLPFSTPDKGLTVNAVHATVNVVGLSKVDLIVASSKSDIGNCP